VKASTTEGSNSVLQSIEHDSNNPFVPPTPPPAIPQLQTIRGTFAIMWLFFFCVLFVQQETS